MATPIEVGTTLYTAPRHSNKLPNGTEVSLTTKVTKITEKHFTTEDNTRWTLSEYNNVTGQSWKRYGDGNSHYAAYIRREPTHDTIMTPDQFKAVWTAHNAEKKSAEDAARLAVLENGIDAVMDIIVKAEGSFGVKQEARSFRNLLNEEQMAEYIEALEYKLADTLREFKSLKGDMRSIGEQLIRKSEGRW